MNADEIFAALERWTATGHRLGHSGPSGRWFKIESGVHETTVQLGNITVDLDPLYYTEANARHGTTVYAWDRDRAGDWGATEPANVVHGDFVTIPMMIKAALAKAKSLGL